MAELEKAGVPTAAFVARDFVKDWHQSAPVFGVKELPGVIVPHPFIGLGADDLHGHVDVSFEALVAALTGPMVSNAPDAEREGQADILAIEGNDRYEAEHVNLNRVFLEQGWGDGFPLWAPTRERVDAMLRGTRR